MAYNISIFLLSVLFHTVQSCVNAMDVDMLYNHLEHMGDAVVPLAQSAQAAPARDAFNRFLEAAGPADSETVVNLLSDGGSAVSRRLVGNDRRTYFMDTLIPAHQALAEQVGGTVLNDPKNPYGTLLLTAPSLEPYFLKSHTFVHNRFNVGTGYFGLDWGAPLSIEQWDQFYTERNRFTQLVSRVVGNYRARMAKELWNLDKIDIPEEIPVFLPGKDHTLDDRNLVVLAARYRKQFQMGLARQAVRDTDLQYQMGILAPVVPLWDIKSNMATCVQDGHAVILDAEQPNNVNFVPGEPRNTLGGGMLSAERLAENPSPGIKHFLGLGLGNATNEYRQLLRESREKLGLSAQEISAAIEAFNRGVAVSAQAYLQNYPYVKQLIDAQAV